MRTLYFTILCVESLHEAVPDCSDEGVAFGLAYNAMRKAPKNIQGFRIYKKEGSEVKRSETKWAVVEPELVK